MACALLVFPASASALTTGAASQELVQSETFFSFPADVGAENIVARSNGKLLVTVSRQPELWHIDPAYNKSGRVIRTFPNVDSLSGIAELSPDIFIVIAGNQSGPPYYAGTVGSNSVWEVNMRSTPAEVNKIVDVPDAVLLDGLAILNHDRGLLVAADCQGGALYLIDSTARTAKQVLKDDLLAGTNTTASAGFGHIGIDGVKVWGGSVYFTNSAKQFLGRIPVDRVTGKLTGGPSILQRYDTFVDDFQITPAGDFLVSEEASGFLLGHVSDIGGANSSHLFINATGATACAFGRTPADRCLVYASLQGFTTSGVARANLTGRGIIAGC